MKKIDIHTHILPGIDDGARDWETCLEMLALSAKSGVEAVIATPHYLPWRKSASPEEIRSLCMEAEEKLSKKHGISMDIHPGNEIYYNVDTVQDLKENKVLTLAGSRYVLVEFATDASYQVLCRATKDLQNERFIPILAHVERYDCLRSRERMQELRQMGALFQMNVEAYQGSVLDRNSHWAKGCLKDGQIDILASDMHGLHRRPPFQKEKLSWIEKKLDSAYQKELLYGNGQKIIAYGRA